MVWIQIAIAVVSLAVSYALQPKPQRPKNAVAGDFQTPEPPRGEPIPVVFGTVWLKKPGIIYYGNLATTKIKSGKRGKK